MPVTFPTTGSPEGVCVAWNAAWNALSPTYDRLDQNQHDDVFITEVRIRRGRTYVTDQNNAGTIEVDFTDASGALDISNLVGPYWPLDTNSPIAFGLYNPNAASYHCIFRGNVKSMPTEAHVSERWIEGVIMGADYFEQLANSELPAGYDFNVDTATASSAVPRGTYSFGDTVLAAQDVQSRIKALLAYAEVNPSMTNIFSGNVNVQEVIEPVGTHVLEPIQAAADAEGPTVNNVYCDRFGVVTFKGRESRFHPENVSYNITTWHTGDELAVAGDSSFATIAAIKYDKDITKIINDGLITPDGVADVTIPTLEVADSTSITQYGLRNYTGQNNITAGGITDGLDADQECHTHNTYLVDNYKNPQVRIAQLTFRNPKVGAANAAAQWNLLCNIDLGDIVVVTTTFPGGGGFAVQELFVEGITYTIKPLRHNECLVELVLDLSSKNYYGTNPYAD